MDRNLAAFLAVTKCGTLTEASDMLGLTQPSVTKRIANLEAELGAQLFQRERTGMTLTAAGEVFHRRARRIEAEYRWCHEEVATIASAGLSIMRLGAGPLFHLNSVASLIASLKTQFPTLKLSVRTDTNYEIGRALSEGDLDVYLGIIPKEQLDASVHIRYLTRVEHGFVVRADDPHAQQDAIDPADLSDYGWVSFLVDPETESQIQKYSTPKGSEVSKIDIRTTSFATGMQLVKEGRFFMSAPLQLANKLEPEGLVIRPARQGMPRRKAGIHLRKSSLGFGAIKAVLDFYEDADF